MKCVIYNISCFCVTVVGRMDHNPLAAVINKNSVGLFLAFTKLISINIIYKKIDSYMLSHFNAKVQCDALSSENFVNRETHVVICYLVAKSWKFSLKCCV